MPKFTTEYFITRANDVHGSRYEYTNVEYKGAKSKVIITCPIHGKFEQTPNNHLSGKGCPKCSKCHKYSSLEWIEEAVLVHRNTYDYSKVNYLDSKTKVIITCPIHGEFKQTPNNHLSGNGCPKCKAEHIGDISRGDVLIFINNANNIHDEKYDYSKVKYVNNKTKVIITCPIHGEFLQRPNDHLQGKGCMQCSITYTPNTNEAIASFKDIHGNDYDYSKVNYVNSKTKVIITCPIHGEFLQRPNDHLMGCGCPKCNISKGERIILEYLTRNDIKFKYQHTFNNCTYKRKLPFDFFIPSKNILIEYDGRQHYEPVDFFGGNNGFQHRVMLDDIKSKFATQSGMDLIRIPYFNKNNIDSILDGWL